MKRSIFLALVGCLIFCGNAVNAQSGIDKAYSLFLYNFAKYSQWPESGKSEFEIAVVGNTPVHDVLNTFCKTKSIAGKKVTVKRYRNVNEVESPEILFVPEGMTAFLDKLIKNTEGKPIMIVTQRKGQTDRGAVVSFYVERNTNKLKFKINDEMLQARNLRMSKSLKVLASN